MADVMDRLPLSLVFLSWLPSGFTARPLSLSLSLFRSGSSSGTLERDRMILAGPTLTNNMILFLSKSRSRS